MYAIGFIDDIRPGVFPLLQMRDISWIVWFGVAEADSASWKYAKTKDLAREMPMNCGSELCSRDEDGGFTGKKEELQESEVYPVLFGEAVADFFINRIS